MLVLNKEETCCRFLFNAIYLAFREIRCGCRTPLSVAEFLSASHLN